MWTPAVVSLALTVALAGISLGGGIYEYLVVDPYWPRRPGIIQPTRGGISRRRFWIPAHIAFEVALVASLVLCWRDADVRIALLVALAAHAVMRVWSFLDFVPKAVAFEKADPADVDHDAAVRWTRRSLLRLPLDLVAAGATIAALAQA